MTTNTLKKLHTKITATEESFKYHCGQTLTLTLIDKKMPYAPIMVIEDMKVDIHQVSEDEDIIAFFHDGENGYLLTNRSVEQEREGIRAARYGDHNSGVYNLKDQYGYLPLDVYEYIMDYILPELESNS